jgi:hypothetical protein
MRSHICFALALTSFVLLLACNSSMKQSPSPMSGGVPMTPEHRRHGTRRCRSALFRSLDYRHQPAVVGANERRRPHDHHAG